MKPSEIQDGVEFAGAVAQRVGIVRTLFGVIVIMGAILIYQQYRFDDRWTATMQREWERDHTEEVAKIVSREKAEQSDINKTLLEAVQEIKTEVTRIHANQRIIMRQLDLNGGDD